jgi:ABC-type phosphate transport system permease subunit
LTCDTFFLLPKKGDLWVGLPSLIFGFFGILAGGLVLLVLPETLGQKLPETIQEAEDFGKK